MYMLILYPPSSSTTFTSSFLSGTFFNSTPTHIFPFSDLLLGVSPPPRKGREEEEMGSFDRSKKRIQLWKRALIHFSLCFFMGFFIGFAPSGTASIFSNQVAASQAMRPRAISPEAVHTVEKNFEAQLLNRSAILTSQAAAESSLASDERDTPAATDTAATTTSTTEEPEPELELKPRRLLILVTTTRADGPLKDVLLRRLGNTLRLVPPPLLWVVVESHVEAPRTAELLRKTGVMYRHLVFKGNFTDPAAEADHQRNVALNHIENHRLHGIVHFAGLSHVYDLQFFDMIRETEVFGAWPVASVSANRKRVALEGPVCRSSRLRGWHLLKNEAGNPRTTPKLDVSSFAFNSSILWDPERWGRPTSLPDISQDSTKFVQEVVLEDESKLKAMPSPDCSRISMWRLHIPRKTLFFGRSPPSTSSDQNVTRRR